MRAGQRLARLSIVRRPVPSISISNRHSRVVTAKLACPPRMGQATARRMATYCHEERCDTQAHYGCPEERKRLTCSKHKEPHHIDLYSAVCQEEGCDIQANFGCPEEREKLTCSLHKKPGHVNFVSAKCAAPDCSSQSRYGDEHEDIPIWCGKHHEQGQVDLRKLRCNIAGCSGARSFGNPEEEGVGLRCREHKLDGDMTRLSLRRLMKERLGMIDAS